MALLTTHTFISDIIHPKAHPWWCIVLLGTQTCRKQGLFRCRFHFPKRVSATTHLKCNRYIGNKARFYILKREQGDEYINPYNPHIPRAWDANMLLQMVGSIYTAAQYICHYMRKGEPKELKTADFS